MCAFVFFPLNFIMVGLLLSVFLFPNEKRKGMELDGWVFFNEKEKGGE